MINAKQQNKKAVIIGYGNLAFHLGSRLLKKGFSIEEIVGKNPKNTNLKSQEKLKKIATDLHANICTDLKKINQEADVYFICTGDNVLLELSNQIKLNKKLVIHCSGSVPLQPLKKISSVCGVLYPLQTFSKNRKLKWKTVPFLLEASNKQAKDELNQIANSLSKNTFWMTSSERRKMHLAAVISSNFSNHLLLLTQKYLNNNLHFKLLFPLLQETFLKVEEIGPETAQTGPAIRKDEIIISEHLKDLQNFSELKELYQFFTTSIQKHHTKK